MSKDSGPPGGPSGQSTAFLLAQVGAQAAAAFAARLTRLGLVPAHAGILRVIAISAGLSQRKLARQLGILPSRLVVLVDELESKGLIERRDDPEDRRTHALYLTESGRQAMKEIGEVAQEHDKAICGALTAEEKQQLTALLARIADQQGLSPGVHPGYRSLGRKQPQEPCDPE
jgi:DNA-binding MarR family transcriptional regulator